MALLRDSCVDDCGTTINPMLTIGQVQGGLAQGIGQAMLEHTVYDPETGQLLSGSFMDHTVLPPRENLRLRGNLKGGAMSVRGVVHRGSSGLSVELPDG